MAYPYRLSELEIILNKKADETSVIKALTIIHKDMLQETKTKAYATPNFMEALLCKYKILKTPKSLMKHKDIYHCFRFRRCWSASEIIDYSKQFILFDIINRHSQEF